MFLIVDREANSESVQETEPTQYQKDAISEAICSIYRIQDGKFEVMDPDGNCSPIATREPEPTDEDED